ASLGAVVLHAEDMRKGSTSDADWTAFRALISEAKKMNESSDVDAIASMRKKLLERITVMELKKIPERIGEMERLKLNNPELSMPISVGLRATP
ncbi:hypothetical protein, partial [Klebsiella pneumoniae]|uniref:hypothetical protein n=1 Tax=Klebsiella pneumoniae TaxID=573 RepID=UPI0025A00A7D